MIVLLVREKNSLKTLGKNPASLGKLVFGTHFLNALVNVELGRPLISHVIKFYGFNTIQRYYGR